MLYTNNNDNNNTYYSNEKLDDKKVSLFNFNVNYILLFSREKIIKVKCHVLN